MVNLLNLRNEILEKEAQFRILKQEKEKIIQNQRDEKNTQESALRFEDIV